MEWVKLVKPFKGEWCSQKREFSEGTRGRVMDQIDKEHYKVSFGLDGIYCIEKSYLEEV